MKILFAGTPEIGVPTLEILAKEFDVCAILTNPDRPKGRKKVLQPSPVKAKALELNIEVLQPEKLDDAFYAEIDRIKPDLLVGFAFGKIFRQKFLDMFPYGGINIHPSMLPKYRGATPLNAAILNGDKISGISIQRFAKRVDSGNILLQEEFVLDENETTGSLSARVAKLAAPYSKKVVDDIKNDNVTEWEQDDSKATFCKLINKDDGIIDWSKDSDIILNEIKAYNPWPLAHTHFESKTLNILEANLYVKDEENEADNIVIEGEPGKVLLYSKPNGFLVKTGDGAIFVTNLQLQSKKALDYKSFNNGVKNFVNTLLG